MRSPRHSRITIAAAVSCLAAVPVCPEAAAGDAVLLGASSDDHLWFVVEHTQPDRRTVLRHHAGEMDGPYYSKGWPLSGAPAAMAAWDNRLWLVFAPKPAGERVRREMFTVQVDRVPALGMYVYTPSNRLGVVESLEGLGILAGFVATARGPVALVLPTQRAGAGVRAGKDSLAAEPVLAGAKLLQLTDQEWTELPLPEGFMPGWTCQLGVGGRDGQAMVLVTETPGDRRRSTVYWRDAYGTWTRRDVPLEARRLRTLTRVGANIAMVTEGGAADRLEISYLRPNVLLALSGLTRPVGQWTMLGMRDGLHLIEHSARDKLTLRRIDPLGGLVSPPQLMSSQRLMFGRVWPMPLLFGAAMTAVLFSFVLKPRAKAAKIALPSGAKALAAVPRLIAVAADIAASGLVVALVFGYTPAELLKFPIWTADLAQATPALLMIAITVGHCTLSELIGCRTLGKSLVGARVVAGDGSRPSAAAIVARNIFKTIVLLIPLLAVFALLNPHLQGLGDMVAGTVVVGGIDDQPTSSPNDR